LLIAAFIFKWTQRAADFVIAAEKPTTYKGEHHALSRSFQYCILTEWEICGYSVCLRLGSLLDKSDEPFAARFAVCTFFVQLKFKKAFRKVSWHA
jgi:hypothetical protein